LGRYFRSWVCEFRETKRRVAFHESNGHMFLFTWILAFVNCSAPMRAQFRCNDLRTITDPQEASPAEVWPERSTAVHRHHLQCGGAYNLLNLIPELCSVGVGFGFSTRGEVTLT